MSLALPTTSGRAVDRRGRRAKIVATLGPASSDACTIRALFDAGADLFRLNMSHGTKASHRANLEAIRAMELDTGRPVAVLLDLQGPKLRIGAFAEGPVELAAGSGFRLDTDAAPGDGGRVCLPHPEIFAAMRVDTDLLLDDGRLRLRVTDCGAGFIDTVVVTGGWLSDRKGLNVPSVLLPMSALTDKDRVDLAFGLEMGVDWVALSFVQRPEDLDEVHAIVRGRAGVMAKLEKPAAIAALEAIVRQADAVMVARGDLGVELPAEQVPRLQKRIIRACRAAGKPVIVATQMLESMIHAPVPTRAEASDVATAIYEGSDAVMLSAESASGRYPREAVGMMDRIIREVESDCRDRPAVDVLPADARPGPAAAISQCLRTAAALLRVAAIVTYSSSGATALRVARERPAAIVLSITPDPGIARRLVLSWGVHSVHLAAPVRDIPDLLRQACEVARDEDIAVAGDHLCIAAGTPFGVAGSTNFIHIVKA